MRFRGSISSGFGSLARFRVETLIVPAALILIAVVCRIFINFDEGMKERTAEYLRELGHREIAFLIVPLIFVLAELAMLPMTIMVLVTGLAFEPEVAFLHALAGCVASAMVGQFLGRKMGAGIVDNVESRLLERVRKLVTNGGIWAVAVVRLLPIAPYAVVSMMLGALRVRPRDVALGTAIGMAPEIAVLVLIASGILSI